MKRTILTILIALTASIGFADTVFIPGPTKTAAIDGAPYRVYLDETGEIALDADANGKADRFSTPHTARNAAEAWLHAQGKPGEAFTGVGGTPVWRHTLTGETIETAPAIEPEPEPQPPVEPGELVAIYIDGPDGDTAGDDLNHGRTPVDAVRSVARAKAIALALRNADPSVVLEISWNGGETYTEPWGNLNWQTAGFPNAPTVFTSYGKGKAHLKLGGLTGFRSTLNEGDKPQMSNCHFLNLSIEGTGSSISLLGFAENITIEGCDIQGATISLQKRFGGLVKNVRIIDTVIWNCRSQGIFANGIDGLLYDGVRLYRNGYDTPQGKTVAETADADLIVSTKKHGTYITALTKNVRIVNSFALYNSGAGLQMRTAGDLLDSVVYGNRRSGVDWGVVNGSPVGIGGWTGEVARNYLEDNGASGGLGMSNIRRGHVHHNILVWGGVGWERPAYFRGDWGPNAHPKEVPGGARIGINELVFEHNDVYGSVGAQHGGWGIFEGIKKKDAEGNETDEWLYPPAEFGVIVRNNRMTGSLVKASKAVIKFSDAEGNFVIDGDDQFGVELPAINRPDLSPETIKRILNREIDTKGFIEEIKDAA